MDSARKVRCQRRNEPNETKGGTKCGRRSLRNTMFKAREAALSVMLSTPGFVGMVSRRLPRKYLV